MSAVQPRERGIIFTGPNVRAIMDGRKTQTRRVLKPQPFIDGMGNFCAADRKGKIWNWGQNINRTPCLRNYVPAVVPFGVGQRLWVREGFAAERAAGSPVTYRAAHEEARGRGPRVDLLWRSPIHMPRWASRLTLAVTDVRVQRLQEISCADAIAEGILPAANSSTIDCDTPDPRADYRDLWNSIHGLAAWDANPWVAAISFTVHSPDAAAPAREADHA